MIIGICGRENSGKTTLTNLIVKKKLKYKYNLFNNPLNYILSCLFNWDYNTLCYYLPFSRNKNIISQNLKICKYIFTYNGNSIQFLLMKIISILEIEYLSNILEIMPQLFVAPFIHEELNNDFNELSFSLALKKICVPLSCGISFEILLGETVENRIKREQVYDKINISGRSLLQIIGTNVFRKYIDDQIWINIVYNKIKLNSHKNFIISDIRFENEYLFVKRLNNIMIIICRDIKELKITEDDKNKHITSYNFLNFININSLILKYNKMEINNEYLIVNDRDIKDLETYLLF